MLDFSETRDRVIPVSGKVNNPSSPTIPRNGCAPALSWTRIDIIIDTLMKVLIHFIFLHPLNIIKISGTSLALVEQTRNYLKSHYVVVQSHLIVCVREEPVHQQYSLPQYFSLS